MNRDRQPNRHFESIIDQDRVLGILSALIHKETVPHALLLTGPVGVGKKDTAMAMARSLNCKGEISDARPCGCASCKKIRSSNHPDVILVEPSGAFIKVDQIRRLLATLAMKPYEARARVVVIADAHAMNPESGNALLKILEEPPERTHLVLTTVQKSDILPTIVSRCQHLRFNPVSFDRLKEILMERGKLEEREAQVLAGLSRGSLARAVSMAESGDYRLQIKRRDWLLGIMETLETLSTAALLAFCETLSKNKDLLTESLDIVYEWFRDLLVVKYDPENLINRDLKDRVRAASEKITAGTLISNIKAVEQVQQQIKRNVNTRLAMEVLILKIATDK